MYVCQCATCTVLPTSLPKNSKVYEEKSWQMYWPCGTGLLKNPNMLHLHIQIRYFSCSKILMIKSEFLAALHVCMWEGGRGRKKEEGKVHV